MKLRQLRAELLRDLQEYEDAAAGEKMRTYIKSELPCLGVKRPQIRAISKRFVKDRGLDQETISTLAGEVFRTPQFRDERHAAIDLLAPFRKTMPSDVFPLLEEMIVLGAWWDLVDELAIHHVGPLLERHPEVLTPALERWADDENIWKRRTAILAQLQRKRGYDPALQIRLMAPSVERKEFWLRKAIGWALRQRSRKDPEWVRSVIDSELGARMSKLSRKEAVKYLSE